MAMACQEPKEQSVHVQEGDGEVIDRGLFDFLKENKEEDEAKQPKQKSEVLVTVIKKINLHNGRKNEGEMHYNFNDEDGEIKEEGGIEERIENNIINLKNEIENKMHGELNNNEGELKEVAKEIEDTSVEIERVMMEETMWEEKVEGSLREKKEKKGILKKIIEKWT